MNLLAFGQEPNHVVGHVYRRLGLSASLNKTFPSFTTTGIIQRFRQWRSKIGGVGARGRHLYKGGNFARKCISTTPDRGAHIYLAPVAIPRVGWGRGGGTFTGATISLANVFLLHPYIFGPGWQYPPVPPLGLEILCL